MREILRRRLRLPRPEVRPLLWGAAAVWCGAAAGRRWGWISMLMAITPAAALVFARRWLLAVALIAGALSGAGSAERDVAVLEAKVGSGHAEMIVHALGDSQVVGNGSAWFLARPEAQLQGSRWNGWRGPPLLVSHHTDQRVQVGDRLLIVGRLSDRSGRIRGDPFAGRFTARRVELIASARHPLFAVGNALRARIVGRLQGDVPSAALLAGFLVGDTSGVTSIDRDALRRSGLAHYVAVSGSNVALFLLGWWLALGPLGAGPRRRALLSLVGLAVFWW